MLVIEPCHHFDLGMLYFAIRQFYEPANWKKQALRVSHTQPECFFDCFAITSYFALLEVQRVCT
jgi:hypothetical protein